jgi:superfamily II DNA/RNA helicase
MSIINSFENIDLKKNLIRGIYAYGFNKPSKIQSLAIPEMINGKELIAQSHSGTGKTGAFTIGTLQLIDENKPVCQALIITPTHELAKQIIGVIENVSKFMDIKIALCVGKTSINDNIKELHGAHIAVGTPGRMVDMMKRGYINNSHIKLLILDEADEMLASDFREQIKNIIMCINENVQICLFSATITDTTLKISKAFLKDPVEILIEKDKMTLDEISQFYLEIDCVENKFETLKEIYNIINVGQAIVYTNSQKRAKWLYDELKNDNNTCGVIYSSMEASERSDVLRDFRNAKIRLLISTDLLSRGIDIQKLSVVINYELPFNEECYIHRIGRSGRFGKRGVAINLITRQEYGKIKELERYYHTTIAEMPEDINSFI